MSTQQIAFDLATEAIDTDVLGQRRIYFEFEPSEDESSEEQGDSEGEGPSMQVRNERI